MTLHDAIRLVTEPPVDVDLPPTPEQLEVMLAWQVDLLRLEIAHHSERIKLLSKAVEQITHLIGGSPT